VVSCVNLEQVTRELKLLALYGVGWDGYQADTPRVAAIEDALRFAQTVDEGSYRVDPSPDGAVSLCATFEGVRRIYDFEGDSHCTVTQCIDNCWTQMAYFPV
jgi:hypothetical protein